jgi:hypothetical protein
MADADESVEGKTGLGQSADGVIIGEDEGESENHAAYLDLRVDRTYMMYILRSCALVSSYALPNMYYSSRTCTMLTSLDVKSNRSPSADPVLRR